MPEIVQCKICSNPFQSVGTKMCYKCMNEVDEAFVRIRDFLYENPEKSTIEEICEGTDTPKKIVIHLIHENRLSTSDSNYGSSVCQYCRRPISSGIMCDKCRKNLSDTLLNSIPKQQKPLSGRVDKTKMHIEPKKRREN